MAKGWWLVADGHGHGWGMGEKRGSSGGWAAQGREGESGYGRERVRGTGARIAAEFRLEAFTEHGSHTHTPGLHGGAMWLH